MDLSALIQSLQTRIVQILGSVGAIGNQGDIGATIGKVGRDAYTAETLIIQQSESGQLQRPTDRPFQAPPLPNPYVERPEASAAVKAKLLGQERSPGTLVVSAIYGLGGIGKSVLATALAHDPEVQKRFSDGVLWATLGQQPDLLSFLSGWIRELGDLDYKPTTVNEASGHLRTLLTDRKILLVVDDVWHTEHVEPFRIGGQDCCVLVTTREAIILDAERYDMDVMSPEQALALLFEKARCQTLAAEEREQAEALAKEVGYLPLALELAGAQIADGFLTWEELLVELRSELDVLAVSEWDRVTDEKLRKRLSLEASFNLSLRRLSPEQLQHFAWLGVLPEDVTITQQMSQTLWQLKPKQAGRRLQEFWSRALLLPGVREGGKATYRLHDLMHDLAQKLVTAPVVPEAPEGLPGLGLTVPEAHGHLVARYRLQAENGQWHTLKGDGYIHERLSWHLEQAGLADELHQILQEVTSEGRNGWYEACDLLGQPAFFVKDVARAWKLAEESYEAAPSKSIALQVRYALVTTSLNSLASNIPPALMAALVEKGYWTPAQGLAYALQVQEAHGRARATIALTPYIPEALLPELVKVTRQIQSEYSRADALRSLAEHLPDSLFPEALDAARNIQSEYYRAGALRSLAQLQPDLFPEALDAARNIQTEYHRAYALSSLAEHLPESLFPAALDAARNIQTEYHRAYALSRLAQLQPDLFPEALDAARNIQDESDRALALSSLAEHLPESLFPEALDAARNIQDESDRADALRSLAQRQPDLFPEALDAARNIQDESDRADALRSLAQRQPDLFPEALDAARNIQDESDRADALRSLAQRQPDLFPEALDAARNIQSEYSRADALSRLAEHLPESLFPAALDAARNIQDESDRARALRSLAQRQPDLFPEALDAALNLQSESDRADALSSLAEHLPESLFPAALDAARNIQTEYSRADALRSLAEHLPESLFPAALDAARNIQDESDRARALSSLAQLQPDLFPEALDAARNIQSESGRADALSRLAQLQPDLFPAALDAARNLQDESYRADALSRLAQLQPDLFPEALDAARNIQSESGRADALSSLAEHLPESLFPVALDAARNLQDEYSRADALSRLAEHLPESLFPAALDAARNIQDESYRADALSRLAEHLPESLFPAALDAARNIQDESYRADALSGLTDRLLRWDTSPRLWQELLHGLARRNRKEFLEDLARLYEAIEKLGGPGTIFQIVRAMNEVCQQWP